MTDRLGVCECVYVWVWVEGAAGRLWLGTVVVGKAGRWR